MTFLVTDLPDDAHLDINHADMAPQRPRFLISEALPLHVLGLVPPPPGIGPHLLMASPLEVALAAALATAEIMSIEPSIVPEPGTSPSERGQSGLYSDPEAFHLIDDEASIDLETRAEDGIHDAAAIDVPVQDDTDVTPDPAHNTSTVEEPEGALEQSVPEPITADIAVEPVEPLAGTITADVEVRTDSQSSLATLDLSRRGAAMGEQELASSMPGGHLPLRPVSFAPVHDREPPPLERPVSLSSGEPPERVPRLIAIGDPSRSYWPGFLTGFVMALAIGAGLYVSLVGG